MQAFIFPCDPLNNKKVDPAFEQEKTHLSSLGFSTYLIDIDDPQSTARPHVPEGQKLIYRGWMLQSSGYTDLNKKLNGALLVSSQSYLNSHHLPNWYDSVQDYTPESFICSPQDATEVFKSTGWEKVFVKDYVKSLKTPPGSIASNQEELGLIMQAMLSYRGLIEGGIVLRQYTPYEAGSEHRLFVVNSKVFAPSNTPWDIIEFAQLVAPLHKEVFYCMDVARTSGGSLSLVEIGDAQVSDLVGWSLQDFSQAAQHLNTLKQIVKIKI